MHPAHIGVSMAQVAAAFTGSYLPASKEKIHILEVDEKNLLMAYYSFQTRPIGLISAIGSAIGAFIDAVQYARTVNSASKMTDSDPQQIGLTRGGILFHSDTHMGRR